MFQKWFSIWTLSLFFYYLLHMKMKKMLVGAFLGMFAVAGIAVLPNYASAQHVTDRTQPGWENGDIQEIWGQKLNWPAILDTIKNAINWILGILATIALIICLYGWFLMVTSAGDDKKYGNWLNVLKNAAIGLAIIWLSWMIVSVIFWFVWTLSKGNQTESNAVNGVQSDSEWTSLRDWNWSNNSDGWTYVDGWTANKNPS